MNVHLLSPCSTLVALVFSCIPALCVAQASLNLADLSPGEAIEIIPRFSNAAAGSDIALVGDVNGDGVSDLLLGNDGIDPGPGFLTGEAYLVFGTDEQFPTGLSLSALDGSNGFRIPGLADRDQLGRAVGGGDVNGDLINDVVIGAFGRDISGDNLVGEAYVIFGSTNGFDAVFDLSGLNGANGFTFRGSQAGARVGESLGAFGDFDDDGVADLPIGAPTFDNSIGEAYLLLGSDQPFPALLEAADLDGANGFVLTSSPAQDGLSDSISMIGDINADGVDDLMLGAPFGDSSDGLNVGQYFVVFGSSAAQSTPLNVASLDGSNGFVLNGVQPGDGGFAIDVRGIGDFNGDGIDDFLIGSGTATPPNPPAGLAAAKSVPTTPGAAYLVFGSDQGFPAEFPLASLDGSNGVTFTVEGPAAAGSAVAAAGDINGDGLADLLIGAPIASTNLHFEAGIVYLVYGTAAPLAPTIDLSSLNGRDGMAFNGAADFSAAGNALDGGRDFNGDGLDDFAMTADRTSATSRIVFGNAAPAALAAATELAGIVEDEVGPSGSLISETFAALYDDNDPFGGLAVVADDASLTEGRWQFSSDGISFDDLPASLSDAAALVLGPDAQLRFVPAPDFSGRPGGLTIRLWDGRWRSPGTGVDIRNAIGALGGFASDANRVNLGIDVQAVNDAPTLVASDPPAAAENSGPQTVAQWASLSAGPANEAGQIITVLVSAVTNPGLFAELPAVDEAGNLTYTPAAGSVGESEFTVVAMDSGGTANGGVDQSLPQTFRIEVQADLLFANSFE